MAKLLINMLIDMLEILLSAFVSAVIFPLLIPVTLIKRDAVYLTRNFAIIPGCGCNFLPFLDIKLR